MPCGMIFNANNLLMMHRIPHTDCSFVNNTFDYYLNINLNFSLMSMVSFGAVNES